MKKSYTLLVSFMFVLLGLNAQDHAGGGVITASEFHLTRPLREIFAENPVDESMPHVKGESPDKTHRIPQSFPFTVKDGPQYGNEPGSIQQTMGNVPSQPVKVNWLGQTASGFRPYDPSGAVGPNHYVQMINSTTFKVYNKTTGTVLLTGTLGNLWSPAVGNNGDPIVMYDKAANRWFLSQFGTGTDKKIYIAVSQTSDPTGAYYTYTFVSPAFPDYLKFGVWTDGYYMTSNQSPQKVFAFNRAEILAGTPGARSIYQTFSPPTPSGFFCVMPGDAADGTLPPAGSPCPIFSYSDNGWGTGYTDAVNIFQMAVNWAPTTPTATITSAAILATDAFDASYDPSWNDCSQPGTTQKLDGIGGIVMYRPQWKSWTGYNTVLLNWGVKINTSQRSIKWVELRQSQVTGTWSIYQQGIYAPDASTRWMGSIAMDNNGSIGLSYIKSNATSIYPGLYYTGRRSCDPLGTMPLTEVLVEPGTGSQTGMNRVGDYSQVTLDMDGVTFWCTSEYMGGTTGSSAARTRIFSYSISPCSNVASVSIALSSGTNPACSGSSLTFTATPVNGGSGPTYQWRVNGNPVGTNSPTFTTTSLVNGDVVSCVMTSNLAGVTGSPATSNSITMAINPVTIPSVSIAITAGSNPMCAGSSVTFTATAVNGGTPTYQWKVNGTIVGGNSPTYTTNTLTNGQIVTCVMYPSANCTTLASVTSNAITMTVNPVLTPVVSIAISGGSNPSCAGSVISFSATSTNGGTPSFQWKVNGSNVGTNSPSYSTSALTNGQTVTCVMTSTATCASPVTANSNGITATINPLPVVSAANASGCQGVPTNLSGSPAGGSFSVPNPYSGPSTTFTYTYTNTNGCTATSAPANITINSPNSHPVQSQVVCNTYTWPVNGVTYTASGIKNANYQNVFGCDSSYSLNLTVNQSSSSNTTINTNNPYTWTANGVTYSVSGVYTHTLTNAVGCDSLLTLQLSIVPLPGIYLSPRVLLAGPYQVSTGMMHDSLRSNHLIPVTEPYSTAPLNWAQIAYPGGESTNGAVLMASGPNAVVDWVYLELRSSTNAALILATKRAMVQRDGDVVSETDGISPVLFANHYPGNYHVSIKHRNHLGVMTATPVALGNTTTPLDFTTIPVWTNPAITNLPRKLVDGKWLLHSGDVNMNKNVKYNGYANDKDPILNAVGVATPNATVTGYRLEDVNLDAKIRYNNLDNDRGALLNSVGPNTPNMIIFQHTPN